METRFIDLDLEQLKLSDWQKLDYQDVKITGFLPFALLPQVRMVRGTVLNVNHLHTEDDGDYTYTQDVDVDIIDIHTNMVYTLRIRTREELVGYDDEHKQEVWKQHLYIAKLNGVREANLPPWADTFEEYLEKLDETGHDEPCDSL